LILPVDELMLVAGWRLNPNVRTVDT